MNCPKCNTFMKKNEDMNTWNCTKCKTWLNQNGYKNSCTECGER